MRVDWKESVGYQKKHKICLLQHEDWLEICLAFAKVKDRDDQHVHGWVQAIQCDDSQPSRDADACHHCCNPVLSSVAFQSRGSDNRFP